MKLILKGSYLKNITYSYVTCRLLWSGA